jgi:GcrA cell cycle regulator
MMADPRLDWWTAYRVSVLILLWDEGVSTAEIGRRMGCTKNAVIGKVHRLGLTPRVIANKNETGRRCP